MRVGGVLQTEEVGLQLVPGVDFLATLKHLMGLVSQYVQKLLIQWKK